MLMLIIIHVKCKRDLNSICCHLASQLNYNLQNLPSVLLLLKHLNYWHNVNTMCKMGKKLYMTINCYDIVLCSYKELTQNL